MRIVKSISVCALLIGLAVAGVHANGKPPLEPPIDAIPQPDPKDPDPKMAYFLFASDACADCARNCELAVAHCATALVEGKKEYLPTLRAAQDCATICSAAASVFARNGPSSDLICLTCAEACHRCREACLQHSDPIMKQCADECRRCEDACRKMRNCIVKPNEKPQQPEK